MNDPSINPHVRVRLSYISRDHKKIAPFEEKAEVHSILLEVVDTATIAERSINLYSVDPDVCTFIAHTKIGEEFDLLFMPVKQEERLDNAE